MPSAEVDQHSTVGAGAVIVANNRILLVRLAYGPAKGSWILPGGMCKPCETPAEAAVREVFEETGTRVKLRRLIAVRHRREEVRAGFSGSNIYWVFEGKLRSQPSSRVRKLPRLRWPEEEILEARFWEIDKALRAREVRPMTRLFIRLWKGKSGLRPVSLRNLKGILPGNDLVYS